ncbi:hypothetical protein L208DRAFT_1301333 [Tricholoma matsutake]|nr:hypothetical protein L208DRAFT_1301333 [Tricholoma matsutake 945]
MPTHANAAGSHDDYGPSKLRWSSCIADYVDQVGQQRWGSNHVWQSILDEEESDEEEEEGEQEHSDEEEFPDSFEQDDEYVMLGAEPGQEGSISLQHISWRDLPNQEEGLGEFLTGILECSCSAAQRCAPSPDDNNTSISHTTTLLDKVARSPGPDDYPLWRVHCRLGTEQEIVFFLLQIAVPHHQLQSVFMHNSIHGWVYLETTMNEDLVQLLQLSPGIGCRNVGIIQEQVDFVDWMKVLSQHDSATNSNLAVGDWVRVLKGTYKGDIGYVAAVENWRGITLLLVPRLPSSSLWKRKCLCSTTPPEPNLSEPLAAKRNFGIDPIWQAPYVYHFNGYTFEYGLILKAFDLWLVSSTSVHIPTQLLFLYQSTDHPALTTSTFPRPLEWHFAEGEVVCRCLIKAVGDSFAEVDFQMQEGIVHVPLSDLLKFFHPGEFVEVMGRPFQGQSGWVEGGWDNIIHVAVENRSDDATEVHDIKVGPFFNSWHLN